MSLPSSRVLMTLVACVAAGLWLLTYGPSADGAVIRSTPPTIGAAHRAATPQAIAHIAGSWIPNDPGSARAPGGWERLQWNFLPEPA